jgi:CRP/FNR family transcriptional regulator, anaerobic regulatory protein
MYTAIRNQIKNYIQPTEKELSVFTSKLSELRVAKRKNLLQPNTYVRHEYFVVSGCLQTYYLDHKGNRHIIQFAVENWWVGDFDAFYNYGPSKYYIEAIEDSHLLALNYDDLQQLLEEAPIFERYFRVLVTGAFIAQRKRILSFLEKDTREKYLEFCEFYPSIENRVPNYHIANYLGVSPENLSRVRRTLKR